MKFLKGRLGKLTEQDKRSLIQSLVSLKENVGNFSSRNIQSDCGLQHKVSSDIIKRCLRKHKYGYFQCRKKGLLTKEDLVKRLKFSQERQTIPWKHLDRGGVFLFWWNWLGSQNKNVQEKRWGIEAREKEGTAGCMEKCFVAIAYGKGVIECHQYEGHVNEEMFSKFVREHFAELFQRERITTAGNYSFKMETFLKVAGYPKMSSVLSLAAFLRSSHGHPIWIQ